MRKAFSFRSASCCLTALFLLGTFTLKSQQIPPYKNPKLPIDQRVKDLLGRMTLEEKAAQTQCIWAKRKSLVLNDQGKFDSKKALKNFPYGFGELARPSESLGDEYITKRLNPSETAKLSNDLQRTFMEKTRLGIPILFHEESLHGNQAKDATHFPSPLGLASSWNEQLIGKIFTVVAQEVRIRGAQQVLAPVVDLALDPRWGRTEETLGEDPYLVSRLALAEVKAYQGNGPLIGKKNVIATLKHFGVHGMPEAGVNIAPVNMDARTLRQVYFKSFQTCVQQGKAMALMPCYNELNGIPAHSDTWLLQEVLRKEWGFKGIVVSDYHAIGQLMEIHHIAKDTLQTAEYAFKAGVDIETPFDFAYSKLPELVRSGRITMQELDTTVGRILSAKFATGLFDDPYTDPVAAEKFIGSQPNRAIALEAAREGMVLLKNDKNLLPLAGMKGKTIAVIGPNADRCLLGGYSDEPKQRITPLQGIRSFCGDTVKVAYAEGCRITDKGDWYADTVSLSNPEENRKKIKDAVKVAEASDVVLLFVGGNEATAREGWTENHLGDRPDLELLGQQNELAEALVKTGKPVIAFVFSGPPLSVSFLDAHVSTLVQCWYLGQETGSAVADVVFGKVNPSGKLPVTIPRSAGHLPDFYYYKPSARRGYLLDEIKPLYPFGHGLSYTTFLFSNLKLSKSTIKKTENVKVSIDVKNTGKTAGAEVVQLYIRDKVSSVTRPVKELKGFEKILLKPSETRTITFEVTPDALSFYNRDMQEVVEAGEFDILVGNSSDKLQSVLLTVE